MQEKTQRSFHQPPCLIGSEHHGLSRFLAIILYVGREVTTRVRSTANAAAGCCEKIADPARRANGGIAPSNFPGQTLYFVDPPAHTGSLAYSPVSCHLILGKYCWTKGINGLRLSRRSAISQENILSSWLADASPCSFMSGFYSSQQTQ